MILVHGNIRNILTKNYEKNEKYKVSENNGKSFQVIMSNFDFNQRLFRSSIALALEHAH